MDQRFDMRPVAYGVILLGCLVSFTAAVVPHYSAGYKLMVGLLISGLLPYVVYGALTEILTGWMLVAPGILVLSVHAALALPERWLWTSDYPSIAVSLAPVWLLLLVLPAGIGVGRWLQRWQT